MAMQQQPDMYTYFLSLLLLFCTFTRTLGDVIMDAPETLTAEPNQWVNFTCTVSCAYDIDWYVEGYTNDISETCAETSESMMVCTRLIQDCSTTMSTSGRTQQLSILAKNELAENKVAVQCAAILLNFDPFNPDPCSPYVVYSRFAFLNVESLPTPEPTPVVCPTPSEETKTVTTTVTVTHTPVLLPPPAVTKIVTSTAVITATPECTPAATANQMSGVRRLHLSSVLRELFTWLCTILTGLAFL